MSPPPPPWREARIAAAARLHELLGVLGDDAATAAEFATAALFGSCRAVAHLAETSAEVGGWGPVTLRGVIESEASQAVFVAGTSGAAIGSAAKPIEALGIQSLCLDPETRRRSYATTFAAAEAWLRAAINDSLAIRWQPT